MPTFDQSVANRLSVGDVLGETSEGVAGPVDLSGAFAPVGGRVLTSGEATAPVEYAGVVLAHGSGQLRLSFFTAIKTETVTKVASISQSAAASPTLCRIGIYSVDGSGDGTLVASMASDTTMWNAGNTRFERALSASWAKTAGQRYAVGALFVGTSGPNLVCTTSQSGAGTSLALAPRRSGVLVGQTDLPASFTNAGLSVSGHYGYFELLP
jgi:hypothetical protein